MNAAASRAASSWLTSKRGRASFRWPRARAVSWSAGAAFLGWGGWMLLRAL